MNRIVNRIAYRSSWIVAIAFLLLSATAMADSDPSRTLSFDERVEYQRRIEEVRWRYTIWPEANPTPKPSLSEVLSDEAIRSKVKDALRKSLALAAYWQRPITASQLQAEMERMARGTRHAELLLDLFSALDGDPFLIAECLARPVLSDRLLRSWYAYDSRFHGEVGAAAESAIAGGVTASELAVVAEKYAEVLFELNPVREVGLARARLPDDEGAGHESTDRSHGQRGALRLDEGEWSDEVRRLAGRFGVGRTAQPQAQEFGTAVNETAEKADDEIEALLAETPVGEVSALEETVDGWQAVTVLSKAESSIRLGIAQWPKFPFSTWWASVRVDLEPVANPSAGTYSTATVTSDGGCTPDTWRISSDWQAPTPRARHTAVWTGTRMIVWGGLSGDYNNTGGVYDPGTDSWMPTSFEGAPIARSSHIAVWTGGQMIVWGGEDSSGSTHTGGAYDPGTDSWTSITVEGAPSGRFSHTAVWTGDRMIVWGGTDGHDRTNTGGVYDPGTDSWTSTSGEDAPWARNGHTAVWTGDRMIVWGGSRSHILPGIVENTGGLYDPGTDSWTPTSVEGAPSGRYLHTAVWTGDCMIVWGGLSEGRTNTGGVYDAGTDSWTPTSVEGAPLERYNHTAVWTGDRMIVSGGDFVSNTGGMYDPETNSWTPIFGDALVRYIHTAVWTGDRMIVWGGRGFGPGGEIVPINTGGVYDPATGSWTATSVDREGAPSARSEHTAVWTGTRMIVWGGYPQRDTGGVYDPGTDSWTPTSVEGAPSGRFYHTAVWTGAHMIVWGGSPATDTGGVYDPITDTWSATSVEGAPSGRSYHTAVWTGAHMIVWGGSPATNTGGAYDPGSDSWTATSVEGAPSVRLSHATVWTGSHMIVWGGTEGSYPYTPTNTGGVYDPGTDSWMATSVEGAPSGRGGHNAVWAGAQMIVWGGKLRHSPPLNTGGVYDPETNSWTLTSVEGAPAVRLGPTAVSTGTRMIIWGGSYYHPVSTGGVYDPRTDGWTRTSYADAPAGREGHTAIYTGSQMMIWGGNPHSHQLGFYCPPPPPPPPPPSFTSPECGSTIRVEPGETVEFTVTAEDVAERGVTLDVSELPPNASMDPALPITGNPVSSQFSWTTDDSHNNTAHALDFTATSDVGSYVRCEVTIEVAPYTLVTLTSFTAVPGDGQVTLHWTTASEIDNAGFYLLRSPVMTKGAVRLNRGLIPAMGDVFMGADYTYVDDSAVNGVEYEYTLVDVDLYGTETRHPAVRAIPNPPDPPVKLLAPVYGATLSPWEIPGFDWIPRTGRG